MQKRALPYNTGKVLIGSRYEPPRENLVASVDAERLQAALLGERSPSIRLADLALYLTAIIGLMVVVALLIREAA